MEMKSADGGLGPETRQAGFTIQCPRWAEQKSWEVAVVMAVWNRPQYLRRCLDALTRSDLRGAVLILVDDRSDDRDTRRMFEECGSVMGGAPVVRVRKTDEALRGVHASLRIGWDLALERFGSRLLCSLDADALVKPQWLVEELSLFRRERRRQGQLVLTGFNAVVSHPVVEWERAPDFVVKHSCGGINILFDSALYRVAVRSCLVMYWDDLLMLVLRALGVPMLCSRPSLVQHIGRRGMFSGRGRGYDQAADFLFTRPWLVGLHRFWLRGQYYVLRRLVLAWNFGKSLRRGLGRPAG